jgi:hypothetical protein
MKSLAWQLQFSMGYEIFFALPGKIATFRTNNLSIFIVAVMGYMAIDMSFKIVAARTMKKKIQQAMLLIDEARANETVVDEDDGEQVNPATDKDEEKSMMQDMQDLPVISSTAENDEHTLNFGTTPLKVYSRQDQFNNVNFIPRAMEQTAAKLANALSKGSLRGSRSLSSLRTGESQRSLKVAPIETAQRSHVRIDEGAMVGRIHQRPMNMITPPPAARTARTEKIYDKGDDDNGSLDLSSMKPVTTSEVGNKRRVSDCFN